MEFLGSVGNKELSYMEQGKKELGLSDEVICFERQNEDWTNVLVNNDKFDYWEFFDYLLEEVQVVGTPGVGFGQGGEGYFRLTAFGTRENTLKALDRIKKLAGKQKG